MIMKKIFFLLVSILCIFFVNSQNIGIGTTTPNSNAILDITSANKAVLLPRVNDTGNVSSPAQGMMIFNKNTNTPSFHNGNRWLTLGGTVNNTTTTADRITYSIVGPGMNSTEMDIKSISWGVSYSGTSSYAQDYSVAKSLDINSKAINMAPFLGTLFTSIEFKYYTNGSATPYASTRLKNFKFSSYSYGLSAGNGPMMEQFSIVFDNYGFKDWINGVEFG